MPTDSGPHCGLVLFDSMPGGAGHVAELLESAADWIARLTDVLFVNEAHHERCISACLDCLLSYETQFDHDQGLLTRAITWEFWDCLRSHRAWSCSASDASPQGLPPDPFATDASAPSAPDRLERARRKRKS